MNRVDLRGEIGHATRLVVCLYGFFILTGCTLLFDDRVQLEGEGPGLEDDTISETSSIDTLEPDIESDLKSETPTDSESDAPIVETDNVETETHTSGMEKDSDSSVPEETDNDSDEKDSVEDPMGTGDSEEGDTVENPEGTDDSEEAESSGDSESEYDTDNCTSNPCVHGECVEQGDSYVCECQGHWDGKRCDTCEENYFGPECDIFCDASTTCGGNGVCMDNGECDCDDAWDGPGCNTCASDHYGQNCAYCVASETCSGRGTCASDGSCICDSPWDGPSCTSCVPGLIAVDDTCLPYCDHRPCWQIVATGQESCFDNGDNIISCPALPCPEDGTSLFCGQDAQYAGPRDFTRSTGTLNTVVEDGQTGLIWQDPPRSGMTWAAANSYCETDMNEAGFGGFSSGWRLPTRAELLTLLHHEGDVPLNTEAFSENRDRTWTSDVGRGDDSMAWYVNFNLSTSDLEEKKLDYISVRCVRGSFAEESTPERLDTAEVDGDPLVYDQATGLVWQQDFGKGTWMEAMSHCEGDKTGGFSDWRMPNINELLSLVNLNAPLNSLATDFSNMPDADEGSALVVFLSSTTRATIYSYHSPMAMGVGFIDGRILTPTKADAYYFRCVREETP